MDTRQKLALALFMVLRGQAVLDSLGIPEFEPLFPFKDGVSQTIAANYWPQVTSLSKEKDHWIEVDQDEFVLLSSYSGEHSDKAALLVHGLNGSFQSGYIQRIADRLVGEGYDVFCMNMRNTKPALGRARTTYHAGRSEDVEACLKFIDELHPRKKIALAGFSLGANVVLKTLGEGRVDRWPVRAAAVSPPVELGESTKRLSKGGGKVFDLWFSYLTYREFKAMEPHLAKKLTIQKWHPRITLKDLDHMLTAPLNGFESGLHYYQSQSAARVYDKIKTPTLVLDAYDDPVICPEFLLNAPENPNVSLVITKRGGHVAFLDRRLEYRRWMDEIVMRYFLNDEAPHAQ